MFKEEASMLEETGSQPGTHLFSQNNHTHMIEG